MHTPLKPVFHWVFFLSIFVGKTSGHLACLNEHPVLGFLLPEICAMIKYLRTTLEYDDYDFRGQ